MLPCGAYGHADAEGDTPLSKVHLAYVTTKSHSPVQISRGSNTLARCSFPRGKWNPASRRSVDAPLSSSPHYVLKHKHAYCKDVSHRIANNVNESAELIPILIARPDFFSAQALRHTLPQTRNSGHFFSKVPLKYGAIRKNTYFRRSISCSVYRYTRKGVLQQK